MKNMRMMTLVNEAIETVFGIKTTLENGGFFHENISSKEAELILKHSGKVGDFIFRTSTSKPGLFAITFIEKDNVFTHSLINYIDGKIFIDGSSVGYDNIVALFKNYSAVLLNPMTVKIFTPSFNINHTKKQYHYNVGFNSTTLSSPASNKNISEYQQTKPVKTDVNNNNNKNESKQYIVFLPSGYNDTDRGILPGTYSYSSIAALVDDMLERGMSAYHGNYYYYAMHCFDEIITHDKSNVTGWYQKGLALKELKQFQEALTCFEQALRLDPTHFDSCSMQIDIYKLQQNDKAIFDCLDKFSNKNPQSAPAQFKARSALPLAIKENKNFLAQGIALFEKQNYLEAEWFFDQAIANDKTNPTCWYYKSLTLEKQGEFSQASICIDKAIHCYEELTINYDEEKKLVLINSSSLKFKCFSAYRVKANLLLRMGNIEAAQRCYDTFLENDKKKTTGTKFFLFIAVEKVKLLIHQKNFTKALESFSGLFRYYYYKDDENRYMNLVLSPELYAEEEKILWRFKGMVLVYQRDYAAAHKFFWINNKNLENEDVDIEKCYLSINLAGYVYLLEKDKILDAEANFNIVLQKYPNDYLALQGMVLAREQRQNAQSAETFRNQSNQLLPPASDKLILCLFYKGLVHESRSQIEEAMTCYKNILDLDATHPMATVALQELKAAIEREQAEINDSHHLFANLVNQAVLDAFQISKNSNEQTFYYPTLTRQEAENRIKQNKHNGAFLFRNSSESKDNICVSYLKADGGVAHATLQYKNNQFYAKDGVIYDTLTSFLKRNKHVLKAPITDDIDVPDYGAILPEFPQYGNSLSFSLSDNNNVKRQNNYPTDEIPYNDLTLEFPALGRGSFGIVYKAKWHANWVAVKQLKSEQISEDGFKQFQNEINIMKELKHPNILLMYGVAQNQAKAIYCIVTEYVKDGSLYNVLHPAESNVSLSYEQQRLLILNIASGLNYLHSKGILHRDLKSPNILVENKYGLYHARLCDFGLSKLRKDHDSHSEVSNVIGTIKWTAPEVLDGEKYTKAADVYSFGVVMWEIVTQKIPFDNIPNTAVAKELTKREQPEEIPDNCKFALLIGRCWDKRSANRLSSKQILEQLNDTQSDENNHNDYGSYEGTYSSTGNLNSNNL